MDKPVCRRCGVPHWRFVKCEDAEPHALQEAVNAKRRAPLVLLRTREGFTDWKTPVKHNLYVLPPRHDDAA